ncbi:polymorphic toxin-type HINT domain-containing protein [Micromonospora yasonensis]|uniref:SpvB/TcaC N-terminal domain-containing protein n=1 Tax=Micromonospora yasonensis TaxID=1128667 RepID=UPI0022322257|nr:SpvB/TcaC N-terminal domain-containing protein [Micromonospora yasonensis]MCW3840482.1 polymorphic toxin-type HINT domain-containing protein [Micromonospora yasonensis]
MWQPDVLGIRPLLAATRWTRLLAVAVVLMLVSSGLSASTPRSRPDRTATQSAVPPGTTCGESAGTAAAATNVALALPDYQQVVAPGMAATVAYGGAKLGIGPKAVRLPTGIGITVLAPGLTPKLDSGMTNVTGKTKKGGGYRFTPHPQQFAESIQVTLPYDPALITDDFTAQDVYTYFFDDVQSCWQVLERVSVDEVNHTVTSLTDHFTDMINATVTVPEHPEGVQFNPNQIKGIQAADPGSQVNLISPPQANNQGENHLAYPIEVPPGRQGLTPQLGLSYNSSSGNGWTGVGWDLSVPTISVETRWGVPRYAAGTETETYLLNGEQLTPVAHRGAPVARTAEKVFHTRVEGSFARIVRHGTSPKNYTWEVTDKNGIHWHYGAPAGAAGPAADASLADDDGDVFLWAVNEVRDPRGNFMRYHYAKVADTGLAGGTVAGRNLYVEKITYTGQGTTEGRYAVAFDRDRELGEALRVDTSIDARGGFKRVTADLLRRIEVSLDGKLIRRYDLTYTRGAFFKTLLKAVIQYDADGAEFNRHEFSYYDDIRDDAGRYQAFRQVPWTSPGDGLGNSALNLTSDRAGDASALNANTNTSGGGHLYVGVGTSPTKSGTVGVKLGFSHGEDKGLLALVDVDGDALPDKVFRDGGTVKYRKNLSGPAGEPTFAAQAQPLNLPGIMGESSNTLTLGVEGYLGAVAAQLDYVNSFATTSQYFSDVNGDGIQDLVNGSTVLFGRVGANGVPVYGVSGDTPAPIGQGQVDADGLFGSFGADRDRLDRSFPLLDSVRRWVAPYDGTVTISGDVRLSPGTAAARAESRTADGVRVAVQKEGTELWSARIGKDDNDPHSPAGVDAVSVARGDRLYFRVGSVADGGLDQVSWDPQVSYVGVGDPQDVNGLPAYRFQASRDFTLGGRTATAKAPLTGTMHLSGDLVKSAATSDDVTVLITRNGTPVLERTIAAADTGSVPVDLDVDVQQGQTLQWRIRVDSPIDVDKFAWTPRAYYTSAQGVDQVTAPDGKPYIDVYPPYTLDLYPVDALTAPQQTYAVTTGGTLTVAPQLAFDFGTAKPTARVAFTVKRRGDLVAKRFFQITNGVVTAPDPFEVSADSGDELWFDFSTTDPALRGFLTGSGVTVDGVDAPSAFRSAAEEGAFPQPYRGWGAVGYNGNGDRAAQPIAQDDLVVDEHYGDQLPDSVDPQAQKDAFAADPKVDPPKVTPFTPSPQDGRWGAGEHSWVARTEVSSARLGTDSVNLPRPQDFAGATAVPRLSRSQQVSVTGSVGGGVGSLGGSLATGDSTGQLDYLDLNGDQYPDVVGAGAVQYTDPNGALGATRGALPDGAVRRSSNVSGNASAGSAARTISTGRGYDSPPGTSTATSAQSGNDMPPLGFGGSFGGSKSDGEFDLLDVNGDSLPDRVYADGRVALNLGYAFAPAEQWRNPVGLNKGGGTNGGVNIGFNTDFYGFAGGASFSQGSSSSSATLADMNGDGLLDQVLSGSPIRVGFNTGNGFETPLPYYGSLTDVNGDRNAKLGGGAYFTFGICFVVVCIVINPGADVATGASRTEQALRDINGDGYADHLASTKDNQLVVAENRTGRTNLLAGVTRPLGARMDFDYTRDGNTYGQPQSRWVLSSVSVNDGRPGDGQDVQLVTYRYSGGVYDRLERDFRGYGTVVEQHRDHGDGDAVRRSVTRQFRTDSFYTKGLLTRELTADGEGRPFQETLHTYTARDVGDPAGTADLASTTATLFPQETRTDVRYYEGQADPGKTTYITREYDAVGNLTRQFDAQDAGTADDLDARIGYTYTDPACRDTWIVGMPHVIDVRGDGTLMRHRESTINCATGDLAQVRAALADGSTATTDLEYYGDGNLKSVTGPPNQAGQRYRLDYTYDTVVNTHVEQITDSFGYTSKATHDFRFGLVETTTDFNNQQVRNTYDAKGRLDTVTGPYEIPANRFTIDFEYHPEAAYPYAVTRHVDRQADGSIRDDTIDTITFVDGLNRTTQTKKDAAVPAETDGPPQDVMVVSGRVAYDYLGRAVQSWYPVTEPKGAANTTFNPAYDPVTPTRVSYDVLDRTTHTTFPDGTATSIDYGFGPDRDGVTQFETIVTDANGKTKRTYTDVRQITTAVKEFNPAGGQPVIWTSYRYDPMGQLVAAVDNNGNVTSSTYDNFGRRTALTNPDTGTTRSGYDLAGNLVRKVTAKLAAVSKAIEYDYDYTRLKAIRYPVFPANNVSYTYGPPGASDNAANRITGVTDGAGTVSRRYGPLGELTQETRTTPAQGSHVETFTTTYAYDSFNRMLSLTFPDGEKLSYHYNSGGQVDSAKGVKGEFAYDYLKRLDYDKFEQRILLDTGNGTRTRFSYNAEDRRLSTIKANLSNGYVFQNLNYGYDNVGNIMSVVNDTVAPSGPEVGMQVGGPSTQTYQYDDLYQLTHAEGSYQPRTPQNDRYRVDLSYDSLHNVTRKTQVHELVSNGATIVEGKLSYDYAYAYGSAKPHAPTAIGIYSLAYDENGNQVSRNQQPKPRRQLIWDEENRLACSHENVQSQTLPQTPASCDNAGGTPNSARYYYDDQGSRVVKDGAQFHIYPNQNYSTRGNKQFKHVYVGQDKLITKLVEPTFRREDRQYYSHSDHLGSTGFVTDDQGGLSEHLQYFPGGETWVSEHSSQPVPQQFTGKEFDQETNLYYFGARYYDPRTQVWQSADPVLENYLEGTPNGGVYASMNLALYTYAYNNPIRLGDPDGRFPWNRVLGGVKLVGGVAEAAAGVALGAATSWTGVGAVAGGAVAVHGVDVAISGARQLFSGEETSSFTSQGLQAAGVSKQNAELIDAGISIVGSAGAGVATSAIRGAATAAPKAAAAGAEQVAARTAPTTAERVAQTAANIPCVGNSFAAGTRVLMADGSTKPIEQVRTGDQVIAEDPETGERGPREVTHLIIGQGVKHLVDVEVNGELITATDKHPFWVESAKRWVDAQDLTAGDSVRLADHRIVTIRQVRHYTQVDRVFNLTVDGIHTYFVVTGDGRAADAVLVHNANCSVNAKILAQNLSAANVVRPAETAAHHIVASGAKAAGPARAHLASLGVSINEAANGVYLPRFVSSANPLGAAVHSTTHSPAYYAEVNRLILQTRTAQEARNVLAYIGRQLAAGPWP